MMTAYLIFTRLKTTDQSEMDTYSKLAGASLAGHPAKPLIAYGAQEALEGEPSEGTVVIAFPSKAEALAWYKSPAYTAAREHRKRGADYQVTVIEGI